MFPVAMPRRFFLYYCCYLASGLNRPRLFHLYPFWPRSVVSALGIPVTRSLIAEDSEITLSLLHFSNLPPDFFPVLLFAFHFISSFIIGVSLKPA